MYKLAARLTDMALNGQVISQEDARRILCAKGAELSYLFAGAHQLKEDYFGNSVGLCSIINAKSGHCAENCSFCAQSAHHQAKTPVYPLKSVEEILQGAHAAEAAGNHCYGIVTSGTRIESGAEFEMILEAVRLIRHQTSINPSVSLGLLDLDRAKGLAAAGCQTYHHNLETAGSFFPEICTTHEYSEDLATVRCAKQVGMDVCCGGIFGLGESLDQRIELGLTLRDLAVDSIPINFLNPVSGTPLENLSGLTPMDCLRIICLYRYLLPDKRITVCGGREINLREFQSWIFMAGANGTMIGNYLTTSGRDIKTDQQMLKDAEVEIQGCDCA